MKWPQRFLDFFCQIEAPFSKVLEADGCREGWLQAECFRAFQSCGLKTNQVVSGVKHDLVCDLHPKMIAEIKIYVDDIKRHKARIRDRGRLPWLLADIETLGPQTGSYLADVLRLMKKSGSEERYMILILPNAEDSVISQVHVAESNREFERKFGTFRVRISMLHDVS